MLRPAPPPFLALTLLLAGAALVPAVAPIPAGAADEAVARVNGVPIPSSSLACACDDPSSQGSLPGAPAPVDAQAARRRALERLIDLELLFQEGMRQRYPDLQVEVERRYQAETLRFPTREQFDYALKCGDLTEDGLRRSILRNLVVERYLNSAVYSSIQIDPAQVTRFYGENRSTFLRPDQARVQHILLKVGSWSNPHEVHEARAKAAAIRDQALAGADFSSLARRFSQEPASAGRGGDWGVISRGTYGDQFDSLIFTLQPGEVGGPVSSHVGFHLIKMVDRMPPDVRPLSEVKGEIVTLLRRREGERRLAALLAQLRAKAKIELFIP